MEDKFMKLLFASDSFKGTLSSEQTGKLLADAAREVFGECETEAVPVADGGEGTTRAVVKARGGELERGFVHGPYMEAEPAIFGKIGTEEAVMEMASASGLPMVPEEKRDPRYTTSFGTGELLKFILDTGCRRISIAIGGSATNDGGIGFARALGVRFLDAQGRELGGKRPDEPGYGGIGADLIRVDRIDLSRIDPRIRDTEFTVMCDVTNPLTGPDGATRTFGAQKGASPVVIEALEQGMEHYRKVLIREFGTDPNEIAGSGAAGGLGAAMCFFLQAKIRSGIETVLDLVKFDEKLENVDLVVTGEGRTDWQSAYGKVMQGVGRRAKARGIPVIGLSGSLGQDYEKMYEHGIASLMTTVDAPMSLVEAMEHAEELYFRGAVRMFRMVKAGMALGHH